MIWKHENNALVIVGGWNPNILLDVRWLKRYLFPQQDDFKVEMPLNLSLPGPPQISTKNYLSHRLGMIRAFLMKFKTYPRNWRISCRIPL